ncbi:DUF4433 domain-containing protein [Microbispora sp. KK1-11]|uniref:type II toxin-antitoxin system toxin DNA ADP-ribosyl transferase DarT n=1 Tax=Microbispora sp. KK1-11 TaxID=2053005 RepID=UPI0021AE81B5|nr:DUF4433 domain-containing protein [Microbispora sp. KK1-11]
MVWHFTHIDNLQAIVDEGRILAGSAVRPVRDVANASVKSRRAERIVDPDENYPVSYVNDHVPFYIAAKSPMLYVMARGHETYSGGCEPLIFLGVALGDIIESGATWCVSDSNAATNYVEFSRNVNELGSFVDFDLLRQRDWYNTPDDTDRKSRRAAEVLVLREVPLSLVSVIVAKSERMLARARSILDGVSGTRQYRVVAGLYY